MKFRLFALAPLLAFGLAADSAAQSVQVRLNLGRPAVRVDSCRTVTVRRPCAAPATRVFHCAHGFRYGSCRSCVSPAAYSYCSHRVIYSSCRSGCSNQARIIRPYRAPAVKRVKVVETNRGTYIVKKRGNRRNCR